MKAERRHDLKTNTLARTLENLPKTGQQYGTRILVGLLIIVLVILLIRYRMAGSRNTVQQATDDLAIVRDDLSGLSIPLLDSSDSHRANLLSEANTHIDQAIANAGNKNPGITAEALVARGDLNWAMANIPSATTRPVDPEQSPDAYLKLAQDAYSQVLDKYPDQHFAVQTARFGLAAIAENRKDWQAARQQLDAIINDKDAPAVLLALAKSRGQQIEQLQHPVIIGEASLSFPSTRQALEGAGSATRPTTMQYLTLPAVAPVLPTMPTTQPVVLPKLK